MTLSDFKRWLYRGQRPNWIARILNRARAAVGSSGIASNYLVTLEVTGRKSGRTISLPVLMAIVDGQRYLVSMLGENVNWVQNVRAAGGRAALRSGGREEVQLVNEPLLRAPDVKKEPGFRSCFPDHSGPGNWRQYCHRLLEDEAVRRAYQGTLRPQAMGS